MVQWPWAIAIFILSMIIFNYLLLLFGKYKKKFSGKGKSTWKKLRHNISRDSLLVVHCYFFFFIYSFRAHSLLHEWLCVSGTLQQWRHASSLLPAHANRSLYFFFLFLCYTQLAVSLTFTKSKADTFLNMYILSFIFLFFLSLFFFFAFLSSLKIETRAIDGCVQHRWKKGGDTLCSLIQKSPRGHCTLCVSLSRDNFDGTSERELMWNDASSICTKRHLLGNPFDRILVIIYYRALFLSLFFHLFYNASEWVHRR